MAANPRSSAVKDATEQLDLGDYLSFGEIHEPVVELLEHHRNRNYVFLKPDDEKMYNVVSTTTKEFHGDFHYHCASSTCSKRELQSTESVTLVWQMFETTSKGKKRRDGKKTHNYSVRTSYQTCDSCGGRNPPDTSEVLTKETANHCEEKTIPAYDRVKYQKIEVGPVQGPNTKSEAKKPPKRLLSSMKDILKNWQ